MSTLNLAITMALFIIVVTVIYHFQKKFSRWLKQKQRQGDSRKQSKISYTRAFFMSQQQHNLEPPNQQLKEIVKQILSKKDGIEEFQIDGDKLSQGRTQRVSSYSFQKQQQPSSLIQKNRKKNNSIDQGQNGQISYGNGNIKATKTTSIPLSQLIKNLEQQNQINSINQESAYLLLENITLSQEQLEQISNCLKNLVSHLRSVKKQKIDKEQLSTQSAEEQGIEFKKLQQFLQTQKFKSTDVVQTLLQYSNFKQSNHQVSLLSTENYKQLTLMCIQSNLKEWADFLLQDMQNNNIEPDRFLLDEYMKIAAK
ncbi:hypothetical protein ABPG72_003980 [Tetrahymena utriculariae]